MSGLILRTMARLTLLAALLTLNRASDLDFGQVYEEIGPSPRYSWYIPQDENIPSAIRSRLVEGEDEPAMALLASLRQYISRLFAEYKNRDMSYHLMEKRGDAGKEGGLRFPSGGRLEWLRQSPQSIIVGTIAAVTLFMGLALIAGIVIRRRYLLNQMATSGSPAGSIIGQESSDKKLAYSAQMYHYQFQKQQILAMEKASIKNELSDEEGTDVETDGDFTVYECAGVVQPSNDIEVTNPLFEGAENSADEASPIGDDELINTGNRSSVDNDTTFVANK